jgi:hypothetical protein
MKLQYSFFLVVALASFLAVPLVSGVNIGISPGSLHFKNMLRNGYSERLVTITIGTSESVDVKIKARGEIADWLEFSAIKFNVSEDSPYVLKIIVKPPADIPNGNYNGFIRFTTSALGTAVPGEAASVVRASVDLAVTVTITDTEIIGCRANRFSVNSAEKNYPVEFTLSIINDGNIRLKPKITIDIWDQEQLNLVKFIEFKDIEILPSVQKTIVIKVPTDDLAIGQYWADIAAVDCFVSDTLTFDVLEPGTLRAHGILTQIIGKVWAQVGETIPIVAFFSNKGEKEVIAQFKGKITLYDNIVKILESEKLEVPINTDINFTMFFTPEKVGRYVVSGRVFYDNKRTYESSTIINVEPAPEKPLNLKLIYGIILAIILILFYKIRKERIKYVRELRELKKLTK